MTGRRYALLALCWMALIFALSSVPGPYTGPDNPVLDAVKKAGHFVLYGVLAALWFLSLRRGAVVQAARIAAAAAFTIALIYAASDEFHQFFTPGRHASMRDVVIDACGAGFFLRVLYTRTIHQDRGRKP